MADYTPSLIVSSPGEGVISPTNNASIETPLLIPWKGLGIRGPVPPGPITWSDPVAYHGLGQFDSTGVVPAIVDHLDVSHANNMASLVTSSPSEGVLPTDPLATNTPNTAILLAVAALLLYVTFR